jgi:hypothetical protein
MTDTFKTNWATAVGHIRGAIGPLIEPDLAKDAARERVRALRDSLSADTQLLSARAPGVLDTLFQPITRD